MALSRAEAIEAFEKGGEGSTARIDFEKAMEKVSTGADSQASTEQEEVDTSDTVVIPEKFDTLSTDDAAGKTTEPKKDAETTDAKKTETKSEEPIDPIEARLELMERELKLKDLKLDRMQVQLENREKLARQRASDLGNIKKGTRQTDPEEDRRTSLIEDQDEAPVEDSWKHGVNVELAQRAMQDEMIAFAGENEEADNYLDKMIPYVEEHRADYFAELSSGNPKAVRRATNLLLREAFIAAKEVKYGEELDTLRTNRQKQQDELKEKKNGSSASGGSAGDVGQSNTRSATIQSVKDLSDDQLRSLINSNRNG